MELLTHAQLGELVDPKNPELLFKLGGPEGVAGRINSSLSGLPSDASLLKKQEENYGANTTPEPESLTFLQFVLQALGDKTLIVLMIAAAFEIAIGIYKVVKDKDNLALIDGGAILIAGTSGKN
jgi:magnesium-transporting ATPase (P-type)